MLTNLEKAQLHKLIIKSNEVVSIELIDWSEKITNEKGWTDNVNVSFRTEEFNDFLGIVFK